MIYPKVTIIMATFNRANFIVETLMAIQKQTFLDWECLIIDDGGTDNTKDVIIPILKEDSRFLYHTRPNTYLKGLPGCRNYGLDLAKGDYIIFFDDDDIPHPLNLELCVQELSNKDIYFCKYIRDVFFGEFDYNFDNSKAFVSDTIDVKNIFQMLIFELPFNSCAVMWKKECFAENRFIESLMYAEEWELYPRIISSGFNGIAIDKCLFYGRKHPNSNTGEFYSNNPIRRESFAEAILSVMQNLKEKRLLNYYIVHHFVTISFNFKEFNLFEKILKILDLSLITKYKWVLFYYSLYIRLPIYRVKVRCLKKIKDNNKRKKS